jgi:hypothetical protein
VDGLVAVAAPGRGMEGREKDAGVEVQRVRCCSSDKEGTASLARLTHIVTLGRRRVLGEELGWLATGDRRGQGRGLGRAANRGPDDGQCESAVKMSDAAVGARRDASGGRKAQQLWVHYQRDWQLLIATPSQREAGELARPGQSAQQLGAQPRPPSQHPASSTPAHIAVKPARSRR